MAVVRSSGKLSGKMGNLVIRNVKGRIIVSARPESYKISMAPSQLLARHKFTVAANFTKNVISLPSLKEIWMKATPAPMYVYNFALKSNIMLTAEYIPSIQNIITPGGFSLPVDSAELNAVNLEIFFPPLDKAAVINTSEVNLSVNALVCYTNPVNRKHPPFQIITLNKEIADYNFEEFNTMTLPLNIDQKSIAAKYRDSIIYLAAATKNYNGKIIHHSSTFAQRGV